MRASNNGELEVSVVHTEKMPGSGKTETLLKKEDLRMAEGENGEIRPDTGEASDAQKALPANPAVVGVTKKLTLNLGNFESVSVSVFLSMPCQPDSKHVNDMYAKINKWVDARINSERESVRNATRMA